MKWKSFYYFVLPVFLLALFCIGVRSSYANGTYQQNTSDSTESPNGTNMTWFMENGTAIGHLTEVHIITPTGTMPNANGSGLGFRIGIGCASAGSGTCADTTDYVDGSNATMVSSTVMIDGVERWEWSMTGINLDLSTNYWYMYADNGFGNMSYIGNSTLSTPYQSAIYSAESCCSAQYVPMIAENMDFDFTPPATNNAILYFAYPAQGLVTPDFLNWKLNMNVQTSTNTLYQIQVVYDINGGTQYTDTFPYYFQGPQTTAGFLTFPQVFKKGVSFSSDNGATINATATLQMVDYNVCPSWTPCNPMTTSTHISFTINNSVTVSPQDLSVARTGTSTDNPVTFQGFAQDIVDAQNQALAGNFFGLSGITATTTLASSTAALSDLCTPASDWTDIGGGLRYGFCTAINTLFVPSPAQETNFQNHVKKMQQAVPFVWLWTTYNVVGSLASSTATTTDIVAYGAPNFVNGTIQGTSSWLIASQNTIDSGLAYSYDSSNILSKLQNAWFNFVIYLLIGLIILMMILILKHRT